LLVGNNEKNFAQLQSLLSTPGNGDFGLDHARSMEEALPMVKRKSYDLLLCDYQAGDGTALQIVHELRKTIPGMPVIFLSDHINRTSVEAAISTRPTIKFRAADSHAHAASQTIIQAVDTYSNQHQLQKAEDMLRKLWRAVEQSAD